MASLSDYVLELFPTKPSKLERQASADAQFIQETPAQDAAIPGTERGAGTVSVLSMEPTPAPAQQQAAAVAFPFDDFAKRASMAQQARRELASQINSIVMGAPKDMRDDLRKSLESEIDFIPKDTPSTSVFLAQNPILLESGKELAKLAERRSKTTADAKSIVSLIDNTFESMPKNSKKQKEHLANFARELASQGKVYNQMMSDNPDALSEGEAARVLPSLKSSWLNVQGILQSGQDPYLNEKDYRAGIELYKKQVQDMHDIMIRRTISDYNNYAQRTSPEIADTIGFNVQRLKPYNPSMQLQVVGRQNPGGFNAEEVRAELQRRRGLSK